MNGEHNQKQYEAYINQDIDNKPLLENCDCDMCEEESRILMHEFLKYDMKMSNSEIQAEMKEMKLI
tara:strand:- start:2851 stop:3048 length:198 start_codon:yes stop_codon:yes gene_type:complete